MQRPRALRDLKPVPTPNCHAERRGSERSEAPRGVEASLHLAIRPGSLRLHGPSLCKGPLRSGGQVEEVSVSEEMSPVADEHPRTKTAGASRHRQPYDFSLNAFPSSVFSQSSASIGPSSSQTRRISPVQEIISFRA